jgi:predicted RNase H-like HicB family nuclease
MASVSKVLDSILSGRSDANIRFSALHHGMRFGAVPGFINMKYEVIIYWSETDKAFIAEVPELPGCTADGTTKAKALVAVERVCREWIETAKELGREIPEPKGRLLFA